FVEDGGSESFTVQIEDLDLAVAGFLSLRDQPGTSTSDPSAHGSAFDRIGAFQDGFLNAAARCVEYSDIFESGGSTAVDVPLTGPARCVEHSGILASAGSTAVAIPLTAQDGVVQLDAPFDPRDPGSIFLLTLGSLETFWAEALEEEFGEAWTALFQDDRVTAF